MNDLNSLLIEGRLTRDAELKYLQSGTALATISIANNRSYKKGDDWEKETTYIDVTVFGKQAEYIGALKKGRQVRANGRIKQERWESNGEKRSKYVVIADHVEVKPIPRGTETKQADDGFEDDIPF
jgi:single-strand DNA-binding protein